MDGNQAGDEGEPRTFSKSVSTSTSTSCRPLADDDEYLECTRKTSTAEDGQTRTETEVFNVRKSQGTQSGKVGLAPQSIFEKRMRFYGGHLDGLTKDIGDDMDEIKMMLVGGILDSQGHFRSLVDSLVHWDDGHAGHVSRSSTNQQFSKTGQYSRNQDGRPASMANKFSDDDLHEC